MCDLIDVQVGRMLAALDASGQRDNTLVIFMSDHGEMLGDHGIYLKGPYFYEPLIHVPLILRSDIYASAAIGGIGLYLIAQRLGAPRGFAIGLGLAAVVGLRLGALAFDWQLPVFRMPG